MDFKIGADPEFFVRKDGEFISAHGLIEGTKKNPLKVPGGAVQVDGMALEFNINPATTFKEFDDNIRSVLNALRKMVPRDIEFIFTPVADFKRGYIDAQPEEARRLGCDPDFNAYTGKANVAPNAEKPFRTASGHIHIGWAEGMDIDDVDHIEACQMMVKQLDVTLGLPSLVWDTNTKRRELYGNAGAYRPKPYGVEYRVLSNVWVNNAELRQFVYEQAEYAFTKLLAGKRFFRKDETYANLICTNDWYNAYYSYTNYRPKRHPIIDTMYKKLENIRYMEKQEMKAAQKKLLVEALNNAAWNFEDARKVLARDAFGRFVGA